MFPILAQHASAPEQIEESGRFLVRWWEPWPYLRAVIEGGPLDMGAHALMFVTMISALMMIRRGRSGRRMLVMCFLPFACGSTAMWLRIGALKAGYLAGGELGPLAQKLSEAQFPFFLGGSITVALMLISRISAGRRAMRSVD